MINLKVIKTAYERFGAIPLGLGRAGENGVVEIHIDISTPLKEYPDASFAIHAKSPDGTEYPVVSVTENETLIWPVCASDTAKNGKGRAQVVMYGANGEIGRSDPVDTLVMTSIIANGNPPDPVQNWLDNVQNASGGAFAPVIEATDAGDAITDAVGGSASSVVVTLSPRLDNGSLAPDPNGGSFVPLTGASLTVNGETFSRQISGEPYAGSMDWVSGETELSWGQVVTSDGAERIDSGTTTQGIRYIRFRPAVNVRGAIACNRYELDTSGVNRDKIIRIGTGNPYIYDNDIDLDNPLAILDGLELLLPTGETEVQHDGGLEIVLNKGGNTITSDSGSVAVTYGIDTKSYIDKKFAELSAAVLGG